MSAGTMVSRRRVPTLAPTDVAMDLAERAYARADYAQCRALAIAAEPRTAGLRGAFALLEARCAREEDDVPAWTAAAERAVADHPTPAGRLAGLALRALANRRAGRPQLADRDWKIVLAKIDRDPAATGLPTYYAAFDAWTRGAFDDAETLAAAAATDASTRPLATALLGACAIERDRSGKAAAYFLETFRLARSLESPDAGLIADTLERASRHACESIDLKLARRLHVEFATFAWPASRSRSHVRTLLQFRSIALLEGDLERAWILSREAVVRASDAATAALCETQAAVSSRLIGDERAARLGLARAWESMRHERFDATDRSASAALATFAREAATDLPTEARKALATFDALARSRTSDSAGERRVRALGEMAHGRIAEVRGNYDAAYDRYRASLDLWLGVRDRMRAAIVALDLQRLARDPLFDETLEAALERAPDAWFAPQSSPASELLAKLTPAETLVLASLLGGTSARAIANDLDRSVHTINNHTRKIFAAFGVTSRAAVLARCADLAITPASLDRIV
ncbi:MAG: hypothetical protein NVS3B17_04500 [Vulcanimicrobiaceae bacterium]